MSLVILILGFIFIVEFNFVIICFFVTLYLNESTAEHENLNKIKTLHIEYDFTDLIYNIITK